MKYYLVLIFILQILLSCKKDHNPELSVKPEKAVLIFPQKDEVCFTGKTISDSKSAVLFKWNLAKNTSEYNLFLKNLSTSQIVAYNSEKNELEIELLKNTPYSWYIVSKSSNSIDTAKSEVWKFYNSGDGEVSHAPFPAELLSPEMGESVTATNGTIELRWEGGDVDHDIIAYDVFFSLLEKPELYIEDLTKSVIQNVPVESGKNYYWKVKTTDSKGNSSYSDTYQIIVN